MKAGLIGGIIGVLIGLAGGAIGTYFSIKNTNGPKERAYIIKVSAVFWVLGIIFIALLLFLASPYKWLLWLPYGIFLPIGIRVTNKRLRQIQQEESQNP